MFDNFANESSRQGSSIGDMPAGESAIRDAYEAGDVARAAGVAIAQLRSEIQLYMRRRIGDVGLADEAFAVFCERFWTSLPNFEWRCSVRTWAYVVARRAAIDVRRTAYRRSCLETPLSENHLSGAQPAPRTAPTTVAEEARASFLAHVREDLPSEDRMLLTLRVDRGLPWEDIARIMLAGEAQASQNVRREAARLRKRFQLLKRHLQERARIAGILD